MDTVSFTAMKTGTRADWDLITAHEAGTLTEVADRALGWLASMAGPSPYQVSRLDHSLQTATRAEADGADEETVAVALLHDIGDVLSPANHSQVAASVLRPYISERNWWIVQHHGLFQGYYWFGHYDRDPNERDRYADHPWYRDTVDFCERWDQPSFDPDFVAAPLEHFEPLVRRLFARNPEGHV